MFLLLWTSIHLSVLTNFLCNRYKWPVVLFPSLKPILFHFEAPVLKIWGKCCTPVLEIHPSQLRLECVVPLKVQSISHIDLFENYFIGILDTIYLYVFTNTFKRSGSDTRSFLAEFKRFEFRVFLLLDWLQNQR